MLNKRFKKYEIILTMFLSVIILYFSACTVLYFFEPLSYNSTDLKNADYSFDMYDKFSYDKNNQFYIKQIDYEDIVSADDDIRVKYVDNTILVVASESASTESLATLFNSKNAEICGFIDVVDMYQLEFDNMNYTELVNICSDLKNNDLIEYAFVDIFEETPASEETSEYNEFSNAVYLYYYDLLGIKKMHSEVDSAIFRDICVGVFDIPVYYSNYRLNVANAADYSDSVLASNILRDGASHGTHVAGIISAEVDGDMSGVLPGAEIYSENATNNSLSYWIAAIVNMIVNENIKAINISMGFNSYIPVSASLGDENSIDYVADENNFLEAILKNLIAEGYDFVLCVAAGNEASTELYKVSSPFFAYGDKAKLEKLDIFDIFKSAPEYADAMYGLCFNAIEDENIKDRIIVVTSCDVNSNISNFASLGDRVDIAAPGEDIFSTGYYLENEYMSGTSMSAPFVTATAALLFELDNTLSGKDVKDIIISSADEYTSYKGFSYPILNIYNAVQEVLEYN